MWKIQAPSGGCRHLARPKRTGLRLSRAPPPKRARRSMRSVATLFVRSIPQLVCPRRRVSEAAAALPRGRACMDEARRGHTHEFEDTKALHYKNNFGVTPRSSSFEQAVANLVHRAFDDCRVTFTVVS